MIRHEYGTMSEAYLKLINEINVEVQLLDHEYEKYYKYLRIHPKDMQLTDLRDLIIEIKEVQKEYETEPKLAITKVLEMIEAMANSQEVKRL